MSEWIPCSERLPDFDVLVLAWFAGTDPRAYFGYRSWIQYAFVDGGEWRWNFEYYEGPYNAPPSEVTHWMPMPEPPQ